jgi:NADH-quinone oxidoreductase subunit F
MAATEPGADASIRIPAGAAGSDRRIETAQRVADGVSVVPVGPTGAPTPPCLCTIGGRTAFHPDPDVDRVADLASAVAAGKLPTAGAEAVVDHDPDTATLPVPETGPLSVGRRRALGPCGWVDPTEPPAPIDDGTDPETLEARLADVGLCGRGRADGARDEPIAPLWRRARAADGEPVVVVHAADTDADADELLCRGAAGHVLEAAAFVADAVGANDTVAFASEPAAAALEAADPAVAVHTAPDSFLVGEPTMALEALEGADRIEARRRPPGPEEWGLYSRPTVIHTPRTLMQLRALRSGASFDAESADPGTRLVTVRGAVSAPATVEVTTTQPLSSALAAVETRGDRYVVGGRFGGFTRSLDVPASAPALSAANLGTAGVVDVLDPGACVVAAVGERAALAREENCGRCVPCREGSTQLHELLRAVYDGDFDDDGLRSLARVVRTTSLCAFGEAAGRPVETAIEAFEPAFRAHAAGRCPAGHCEGLQ